jgi:hypothetical protein
MMMGRLLRRWLELRAAEQWLLIRAFIWILAVRILLWVLPFSALRRLRNPPVAVQLSKISADRFVWAVRVASSLVPKATCLTCAIVLQRMLAGAGYPSKIQIGVNMGAEKRFEAHAWVEREGAIIFGGEEAGRYSQLLAW